MAGSAWGTGKGNTFFMLEQRKDCPLKSTPYQSLLASVNIVADIDNSGLGIGMGMGLPTGQTKGLLLLSCKMFNSGRLVGILELFSPALSSLACWFSICILFPTRSPVAAHIRIQ